MTKAKNPRPKLQCTVCEKWAVPSHPSQQKEKFTCDPFCREYARKYMRQTPEFIRLEWRKDMKSQKVWESFCLTKPSVGIF